MSLSRKVGGAAAGVLAAGAIIAGIFISSNNVQSGGGGGGGSTHQCAGRSFYISFATGSDSNNGTSTATAWQHAPGMRTFTGSYTHQAEDCFYFRGGDTWPNASFPLDVVGSGNVTAADYYGPNFSWYSGGSWTRPIFSAGGSDIGSGTAGTAPYNIFVDYSSQTYVTFDNFEMTGFHWDSTFNDSGPNDVCEYVNVTGTNNTFENSYLHGFTWSGAGVGDENVCFMVDGGTNAGTLVTGNVFDGSDSVISGAGCHGSSPCSALVGCHSCAATISNNVFNDLPNGILIHLVTDTIISGNLVSNCVHDFDEPNQHENSIETVSSDGSSHTVYMYNNVIHDIVSGCEALFFGNTGETDWVYNNVWYNLNGNPPEFDPGTAINWVNNTIVRSGACIQLGHPANSYTGEAALFENNHCITDSGTLYDTRGASNPPTATQTTNVVQTTANATSQGYSSSTSEAYFPPTNSNATSASVNAGTSASGSCSGNVTALCSSTGYAVTWNVSGNTVTAPADATVTRPQGSAWDAGAYER